MYIARMTLERFRNLTCSVDFTESLGLIIGENNIGKSNLIDALRIVLVAEAGPRAQLYVTDADFAHDGVGGPVANDLSISVVLRGLSDAERARMVTCLAPSIGPDAARVTLRAHRHGSGRPRLEWSGGDRNNGEVEVWARTAVTYTYLPALRDASADLRPGRGNRLVQLLSVLADGGAERASIEAVIATANANLAALQPIVRAKAQIQQRLDEMTGPGYRQSVDLAFAEPQFDRIVGALRALIGQVQPLEITESGLGFANLLYMATLLASLSVEEQEALLHVVLVEEPEAHLHPQLQDLFIRHLMTSGANDRIQILATTHSPNLASSAGVKHVTVLSRSGPADAVVSRSHADFGLSTEETAHLDRFLDVTKASLLFARRVLLVEGTAEQLLFPLFAEHLGKSLQDAGVAVINVGGLAFGPFARLFGPNQLPYRCAIVSDGDPPTPDEPASPQEDGEARMDTDTEDSALSATAQKLLASQNDNLKVFLSRKTLEWDIVAAGNWDVAIASLRRIHPRVASRISRSHAAEGDESRADAMLDALLRDKGRFAQALGLELTNADAGFAVPSYVAEAITWLTEPPIIEAAPATETDVGHVAAASELTE